MKRIATLVCVCLSMCLQMQAQTWEEVNVGTTTRKTLTYVPKQVDEKPALVISLHGASQDSNYQMNQTKWNELADTAHIIVTYPQGINNMWDISGSSDTKFVEMVMKMMQEKYNVDKNRIYISGFSMGGMLTYHCMTKLGSLVAAFGPVSGIPVDYRNPVAPRPVPIMHIHGTSDSVVKWEGDPDHAAGGYGSIDNYVKMWAEYEGCDVDNPVVVKPYPQNSTTSQAWRTRYLNQDKGIEVTLIALPGKDHWHSNDPLQVMSTSELWNFFKQYKLNLPDGEDKEETSGNVVFKDNWEEEVINVNEGIPAGWYRVNSSANGDKDEKAGGSANISGARLKDFVAGGDFNTGFYLSARNFDECKLSYGSDTNHRLHLQAGKYQLSFYSTFWNEGSLNAASSFDAGITSLETSQDILTAPALESTGNLAENSNQLVTGATPHYLTFTVEKDGDYELYFRMSQGWNAVIIGGIKIRSEENTGISSITSDVNKKADASWYNLQGQSIVHPTNGIFIHNGKKVVKR